MIHRLASYPCLLETVMVTGVPGILTSIMVTVIWACLLRMMMVKSMCTKDDSVSGIPSMSTRDDDGNDWHPSQVDQ